MSKIEARLIELGHPLPSVAKPVAAYVPSVVTGNLCFTSGQLPFVDGALPLSGKVGEGAELVSPADAKVLAKLCALNAIAALKLAIGDLDRDAVAIGRADQHDALGAELCHETRIARCRACAAHQHGVWSVLVADDPGV